MLSSAERQSRSIHLPPMRSSILPLGRYADVAQYPVDIITADQFPQRAEHRKLKEPVRPVSLAAGRPLFTASDRLKRIMQEVVFL
jgi:hypothetical protein